MAKLSAKTGGVATFRCVAGRELRLGKTQIGNRCAVCAGTTPLDPTNDGVPERIAPSPNADFLDKSF